MINHNSIDVIKNAIQNNKLAHAYLFYGDAGVDVERPVIEAINLIFKSINKDEVVTNIEQVNYYDFKLIKPSEDGKIKKEVVNSTLNQLFETPLEENGIKFLYIKDIDTGNKSSLNRLLKFVEEPVDNLVIFMSTNHFDSVISTIKSRTQNVFVKRERIEQKIQIFKNKLKHTDIEYLNLLANIYPNVEAIQKINFKEFDHLVEEILKILDESLKNKYLLKIKLAKL